MVLGLQKKKATKQLDFGISGHCLNEGLLLREYAWEQEAKRGTSPFFFHPTSLPLTPPTARAHQSPTGSSWQKQEGGMQSPSPSITEQCI